MTEPESEVSLNEAFNGIVRTITKRRWWILLTASCITLTTIATVLRLPDRYTSEATLVVVQPQISQNYVVPASTMSSADVIKSIERTILSRSRLLGIISALGLYGKEKEKLTPEALVELMRKDVGVDLLEGPSQRTELSAFRVSFVADNPRTAQEVTSRLGSLFIEENLKSRGSQAAATTKFLSEQLESAKQRLSQLEQRLRDFKMSNFGDLPEQQASNVGALTDLRMQLQNIMANINRVRQQRISLESLLRGNLARLQSEKVKLLVRWTPRHPEILKKDEEIERTEALLTSLMPDLKAVSPGSGKPESSPTPDDPVIAQLKVQVENNVTEAETLNGDEQRLRAEIAQYQGRLTLTPVREQQQAAILREYETYKRDYTDLVNKQLQSQLTASLEEREAGQQFRLVDPPTLPARPSSPKRLKISLGAGAAGVLLGIALAFLLEARDGSFRTEKDVRQRFAVPLVMGVPLLLTPLEERSRNWRRTFDWVAGTVMALAVFAAEFYVYRRG